MFTLEIGFMPYQISLKIKTMEFETATELTSWANDFITKNYKDFLPYRDDISFVASKDKRWSRNICFSILHWEYDAINTDILKRLEES